MKHLSSGQMTEKQKLEFKRLKRDITKIGVEVPRPNAQRRTLQEDRIFLKQAYQQSLQTPNSKLTGKIKGMLDMNLNEQLALDKRHTPKNAKKHSYYASEPDGSAVHINRYFYPGEKIPNMFTMHGKQYKRGKFTKGFKDSAGSKTLSPSQALAQEKHQNSVVRNDTKDRIVLRVLNNEMSQEEAMATLATQDLSDSEISTIKTLLQTPTDKKIIDIKGKIQNRLNKYGDKSWFRSGREESLKGWKKSNRKLKRRTSIDDPANLGIKTTLFK